MLQARGDLEKLIRNAGGDKPGLGLGRKMEVEAGLVKQTGKVLLFLGLCSGRPLGPSFLLRGSG